jgi:hypothetical protein
MSNVMHLMARIRSVLQTACRVFLSSAVCSVVVLAACSRTSSPNEGVASLSLSCIPAERGLHCRLLALFQDVKRSPRDVTAEATWRISGPAGAQVLPDGSVETRADGDGAIVAEFAGRYIQIPVRLVRDRPGLILATLRGTVYTETRSGLQPVAHARVEVVSGQTKGPCTTTRSDGSYELMGVVPGDVTIRATRLGFTIGEAAARIVVGDNRLSPVIELLPPVVFRNSADVFQGVGVPSLGRLDARANQLGRVQATDCDSGGVTTSSTASDQAYPRLDRD